MTSSMYKDHFSGRIRPLTKIVSDEQGVSALFRQKLELLEESRKKFMKHLNDEQKHSVLSSVNTTQAVLSLVDSARFEWCRRSESGSVTAMMLKRKFHQVCKSLDQNAGLFSMLPKESHYVSVFYGAFNSIVAVGLNTSDQSKHSG
jgi:hypothetical protein